MKISQSIRRSYDDIRDKYERLKGLVDERIRSRKSLRWHYESRIKELESYALKLETGREKKPGMPEDMLGCTLVVENHSRIGDAVALVTSLFKEEWQKPRQPKTTHLTPQDFSFDDLRLYVSWMDDDSQPRTGFAGIVFEVQIKTFLQHAWGIATHDLVYKADDVDWGASRVAFQVKAMLENAELSISEAKRLSDSALLDRVDKKTQEMRETIANLKSRWSEAGMLPKDIQRLAANIIHLSRCLHVELNEIWSGLDKATQVGRGARLLDLSPYGAICETLIAERGDKLFSAMANDRRKECVFIPLEVDLPPMNEAARKRIITPDS